jgi:hypothetical protein
MLPEPGAPSPKPSPRASSKLSPWAPPDATNDREPDDHGSRAPGEVPPSDAVAAPLWPDAGYAAPGLPSPREAYTELFAALGVAVGVAVLGLLLGWAWHFAAPTLPLRKVEEGAVYLSGEPEQLIAADGWFTLLGLVFGALVAVLVWVLARRWRGPIQLGGLLLGSLVGGWLAWRVWHTVGLAEYHKLLASAPVDTILQRPAELRAIHRLSQQTFGSELISAVGGNLLVPAFGAVMTYALLAAWSRWSSLRRHEEEAASTSVEGRGWAELG